MPDNYTLAEIKEAYWVVFHESGELWFNDIGSGNKNEESTQAGWTEFLEALNKIHARTAG